MDIQEYENRTREVMERAVQRAVTVGADNYSTGNEQKFESKRLAQITQDAFEEIEDAIIYLTQLHIKIQNLVEGLK